MSLHFTILFVLNKDRTKEFEGSGCLGYVVPDVSKEHIAFIG
jgi:hypothetical protein